MNTRPGSASRLAARSGWVLLGRLLFGTSVLIQNLVLARVLAPEGVGVFLAIQALVLPCAIFSVWGLDLVAVRSVRHDASAGATGTMSILRPASFIRQSALLIALTTTVATVLLVGLLSAWCGLKAAPICAPLTAQTPLLWPLIYLGALQLLVVGTFRGLDEMVRSSLLAGVLPTVLFLAAAGLAGLSGLQPTLRMLLLVQLAALLLMLALAAARLLRSTSPTAGTAAGAAAGSAPSTESATAAGPATATGLGRNSTLAALATAGPGLMLTQLLALLVSQSDVWVLGLANSPDAVARYGVASRLAQLVSLPHLVLTSALATLIVSHLASGQARSLQSLTRASVALACLPALALALLFVTTGPLLLGRIFGDFYADAAPVLAILALGHLVNVACGPCAMVLILGGRAGVLNRLTACNAAACITAGYLAALNWGMIGLATVYALGQVVQGVVSVALARRAPGVSTRADLPDLFSLVAAWRARRPGVTPHGAGR